MQLLAVLDGLRMGFTRFRCTRCSSTAGPSAASSQAHPLETRGVGWFGPDELPRTTGGAAWWGPMAFAAIDGERLTASFDPPRGDVWRESTPER